MNLIALAGLLASLQGIGVPAGGDVAKALAQAKRGATVTLAGGKYAPSQITVGSSAAGVTLRSKPGERAILDFGKRGGIYIKARGFTLKNVDVLNAKNFGIDVDASEVTIEGCKVLGSGGDAIKLSPGNWRANDYNRGAQILGCEIGANGDFEGIDCVGQDDVRIVNCLIRDTPGWGVYLKGGATNGLIEGCVFLRCGIKKVNPKGGACLGESTGPPEVMTTKHGKAWESVNCTVRNNVFVDIDSAAMAAWCAKGARFLNNTCINAASLDRASIIVLSKRGLPCTDVLFANNIVVGSAKGNRPLAWIYQDGADDTVRFERNCWFGGNGQFWDQRKGGPASFAKWQASGVDRGSIFGDPKLDAAHHLMVGSPCIDKGARQKGFSTDFDGGRRSGAWDIGADEFGAGTPRKIAASSAVRVAPPATRSASRPARTAPRSPGVAPKRAPSTTTGYAAAMKQVAKRFRGKEGVVLHIGDSITYSNPYSQWARFGKGKTRRDLDICRWMHVNKRDATDGWYLASVDRPGGRSETAVSGIRSYQTLEGGKAGIPPLARIIGEYNPRMAVVMLGTNDASASRNVDEYAGNMEKIVDLLLNNGTIPILSTIPPHPKQEAVARSYNEALRSLAARKRIPLIDYEAEILKRRPNDWNGTLLGKNDVHPTVGIDGATPSSEPTEQNLKNSGYLLRAWLSVRKIAEVKEQVLDQAAHKK